MTDPIKTIDGYMHAQGHSFIATDLAREAQVAPADAPDGLAHLAAAVAALAEAVSGIISVQMAAVADAAGIDLDAPAAD